MRILFVVPTFWPAIRYGGVITATLDLATSLVAAGHHVEVYTTNVDGSGTINANAQTVMVRGVLVHYFPVPLFRRIYFSPAMFGALIRGVNEFDFVTLHSLFLFPVVAGWLACRIRDVPYIVFPHGMLVRRLVDAKNRWLKNAWLSSFGRRIYENALAVRVTSAVEASDINEFGWRLPPVINLPNSVEMKMENPTGKEIPKDVMEVVSKQPLVLFFGRMSWKKGLDLLLEAFARTSSGYLAIVGPDDEKLAARLRELAMALRVSERVFIVPRMVTGTQSEELFRATKLMILTSLNENFANSIAEAMLRGLPVIVTQRVGIAEHVVHSGGGIVVPPSATQIATSIEQLLNDEGMRRQMGMLGRQYVESQLSSTRIGERLIAAVAELIRRRRERGEGEITSPL